MGVNLSRPFGTRAPRSEAGPVKPAFLAAAREYRYLHVATHGFFAPKNQRSALATPTEAGRSGGEGTEIRGMHPGLLSGLALAGTIGQAKVRRPAIPRRRRRHPHRRGNRRPWTSTACNSVTLSACETGLGQVAGGEGLLGGSAGVPVGGCPIRRRHLWRVSDDETRPLMERFYRNRWRKNLGPLESLREAQLWVMYGTPELDYASPDPVRPEPPPALASILGPPSSSAAIGDSQKPFTGMSRYNDRRTPVPNWSLIKRSRDASRSPEAEQARLVVHDRR